MPPSFSNPGVRNVSEKPRSRRHGHAAVRLLLLLAIVALVGASFRWLNSQQQPVSGRPAEAQVAASRPIDPPAPTHPAPSAPIAVLDSLTAFREGDPMRFPLPGGAIASGVVTLIRHETGGWFRVAGALSEPVSGSFAFSTDGTETGGLVQFPARRLAYQVKPDPARGLVLRPRPLGEIVCLPLPRPNFETTPPADRSRAAAVPPLLSSRPEATAVLYLDFDGETVTDPSWNSGRTITARAPNLTNSDITNIWRRVKEDFWPFNVDVTTDTTRYDDAPVGSRMRCIITPTDTAAPGAGGVAYVGSFAQAGGGGFSSDIPCWVFNFSVSGIAEAVSHELGHTLGLRHDGRTNPATEYYSGQGSGATGWAPIMGVGYYKSLVQWSKGEYLNANRTEDDLAIISGAANGFGYVADEAGDTIKTAAALGMADAEEVQQAGVIASASDADVFAFNTSGGTVTLSANPAPLSPNLDILLELLDAGGSLIATNNPVASLPAAITATLGGGTYYLRVRGTGAGNVLTTGYTAYGSIGEYTITGTIPTGPAVPTITSAGTAEGEIGVPFSYQIVGTNSPVSFNVVGSLPDGITFAAATGVISGTPTMTGTYPVTLEATNAIGTGSKALALTIHAAGSPRITSGALARGTLNLGFAWQLTATHPPNTFAVTGTLPAGVTLDPATGLLSGVPSQAGNFSVLVTATNASGYGSALLTIEISNASIALAQSLDLPGRSFTDGGAVAWEGQSAVTFDGIDAAQSAPVADNEVAVIQTSVSGPLDVGFRYRVDSEADHDTLVFLVDGVPQLTASGFVDWTEFTFPLGAGNHVLRWEYRKNATGRAGADAAWLDTLSLTSETSPIITSAGFAQARVDVPFEHLLTATNTPTSFGIAGPLPPGVFFTPSTGRIAGTPSGGGAFPVTVSASNAGGTGTQELVISVETGVLDLTSALDQPDLTWTNTGTVSWIGQTEVTHDGVDAGGAINVGDGETATIETEIEGPTSLRFFWRVSSEFNYDYLSFHIDGEERGRISGEVDWTLQCFPIPPGVHRIAFSYRRDEFESGGVNGAWVDEVALLPREGLSGSDSFADAQALTGQQVRINTSNLDATVEPGETGPLGTNYGHSLWWTWTAPATGRVVVSTAGSSFDTILAIRRGTTLFDLIPIASNDNASRRDETSRVIFQALAGQTYFVTVAGVGNEAGNVALDLHYAGRGSYVGIIVPDNDHAAGLIEVTLTDSLAYTARAVVEGKRNVFRGSLDGGSESRNVTRSGGRTPLDFTLATDLANGESCITGTMSTGGEDYQFIARRRIDRADLLPLSEGAYTMLIEPDSLGANVAYGTGYGRAVVTRRGSLRFTGFLPDGRRATQGSALTFGQVWPCHLAPYRRAPGTLAGDVAFDPVAANNFTGALRWRVEDAETGIFSEDVTLTGSYYFKPGRQETALIVNAGTGNVQLELSHRDAAADPADPLVTLETTNRFSGVPAGYALRLSARTGLFSGWFPAPVTARRLRLGGALLQSENRGAGWTEAFVGHGRVELIPTP